MLNIILTIPFDRPRTGIEMLFVLTVTNLAQIPPSDVDLNPSVLLNYEVV